MNWEAVGVVAEGVVAIAIGAIGRRIGTIDVMWIAAPVIAIPVEKPSARRHGEGPHRIVPAQFAKIRYLVLVDDQGVSGPIRRVVKNDPARRRPRARRQEAGT